MTLAETASYLTLITYVKCWPVTVITQQGFRFWAALLLLTQPPPAELQPSLSGEKYFFANYTLYRCF